LAEILSWESYNINGAFNSESKFVAAGGRSRQDGGVMDTESYGYYWTSTIDGIYVKLAFFLSNMADTNWQEARAKGASVRLIKDNS